MSRFGNAHLGSWRFIHRRRAQAGHDLRHVEAIDACIQGDRRINNLSPSGLTLFRRGAPMERRTPGTNAQYFAPGYTTVLFHLRVSLLTRFDFPQRRTRF